QAPLPISAGSTDSGLTSLSCLPSGDCTAAGYFTSAGETRPLIERLLRGRWRAHLYSGRYAARLTFDRVVCPKVALCIAAGTKSGGGLGPHPAVSVERSGRWTSSLLALP